MADTQSSYLQYEDEDLIGSSAIVCAIHAISSGRSLTLSISGGAQRRPLDAVVGRPFPILLIGRVLVRIARCPGIHSWPNDTPRGLSAEHHVLNPSRFQ